MSWTTRLAGLAGVAAGAFFTARRSVGKFTTNVDPLGGVPPRFPTGIVRSVTTDDGAVINTITAVSSGADHRRPLIALVHGLTSNHDDWGPIAQRLVDKGYRVMAIDQRGHGNSTVGSAGYGVTRLGTDLAQVFEALDLTDVVLVGHSMGGMAAMTLMVDHPEVTQRRVRALGLIATAATMSDLRYQAALRLGSIKTPIDIAAVNDVSRLATAAVFGHAPSSFMLEAALASVARCPEDVRLKSTRAMADYDIADRISAIDIPTLVVAGTRDLLTPYAEGEDIADAITGSLLIRMPGAGHLMIWEENEELAYLLDRLASEGVTPLA